MQTQELQFERILQNSPINAFKEVSKYFLFANVRALRWFYIASHLLSAIINYYIFKAVHHSCCSQSLDIPY